MEKLIVIANLGRVRPVKFRQAGDDPKEKAHLVEIPGNAVEMKQEPIRALVTDQAGRSTQNGPGEEHLKSELNRQAMERVAGKIAEIVAAEQHPAWRLVAPQTILSALTQALPAAVSKCLAETVAGDLT